MNEHAIIPTERTLKLRQSILFQFWRFLVINVRMVIMILKSHDKENRT
jgi:hypothetical protein